MFWRLDGTSSPWEEVGTTPNQLHQCYYSGRALAFVPAHDKDRLTVLNITEPTSPRFVSSFYDDGSYIDGPLGLAIDGNFVLLTNQHSDCFVILDYIDPQSASLEGYYCDETNLEQPQRVSK